MPGRVLKIGGWILGGLAVVMVLATILVPLLVPREQLRQIAEERAREATGGEVALGPLTVQVFPRLRLVLGQSSVAVTADGLRGAGQEPGPLLSGQASLEKLEVDLALWPLLTRELEFGQVTLVSPRLDLVTAVTDEPTDGEAEAAPPSPATQAGTGGVGLALATVSVKDGVVNWREEGSPRAVSVRGWQQSLAAPTLGILLDRLARLGGADLPADTNPGPAMLSLQTRVEMVTLEGFAEDPLPPLTDLVLRGELSVPPAADQAYLELEELTAAPLHLTAEARWDAARVEITRLALAADDAVTLSGRGSLPTPPAVGPIQCALSGPLDLSRLLAVVAPWLPAPAEGTPPWPDLAGIVNLDLEVDLRTAPALADATAWQAAWQAGLAGRVEARASGADLTIALAGETDPLTVATVELVADLASPRGRARATCGGLAHRAARGALSCEVALPPTAGSLLVSADLTTDLAAALAAVEPYLPSRPEDAAPLPQVTGSLDLGLRVDLATAPALTDSLAWLASWLQGLEGRVDLTARGGPLTLQAEALGPPLSVAHLHLEGDLRSPRRTTRLTLAGLDHPVLAGPTSLAVVPEGPSGVPMIKVALDRLDLDALLAIQEARQAAAQQQVGRDLGLVSRAWADSLATPVGELIPPDLALDLEATAARVQLKRTPYTRVTAAGTLRQRVIDIPTLRGQVGTGRIEGSARINYAAEPTGRAAWSATASDVPASALLAPYASSLAAVWDGVLNAQLSGECGLADAEVVRQTLRLAGDVTGSDGEVDLRTQLGDVSQFLGSRQDLLRVTYNSISQHLQVNDGKVYLQDLEVDGKDTDWTGDGWVSLDGKIDMGLHVELPAGFTPDLGDLSFVAEGLRDEDGRIGLDLRLSGEARKPAVGLDLDPAAMLQNEDLKKGLEEEVKKGLGGLLDRLKGK